MHRFLQVFFAVFSAILLSLAIPNELLKFGSPALGIIASAPIYMAVRRSKNCLECFLLCFLHGFLTHLLSSFWLGNFQGYALFTLGASDFGTGGLEAIMSLFFYFPALFSGNRTSLEETANPDSPLIPFRTLWFASLYTVWEWVKSTGFLGYPWGTLSMTAFRWPLLTQIADITGPYGVTFLFAFASAVLGEGILILPRSAEFQKMGRSRAFLDTFRCCSVLFVLTLVYGSLQYCKEYTQTKTLNAILVQQNGDPWLKGEENSIKVSQRLTEEKIDEIRRNGKECDLVVWSEAVLKKRFPGAKYFYDGFPSDSPLTEFIDRMNTTFLIGGPVTIDAAKHRYANSALLFNRHGEYVGSYQKMHLVPFAELIPGVEVDFVRKLMKDMVGFSYGWYPGKCVTLFDIPLSSKVADTRRAKVVSVSEGGIAEEFPQKPEKSVTISTPICFDDTAAEVCRAMFLCGSEVFVNVTNDAWSLTDSAEIQHAAVAHYRAIEYRTTLARCTNAGYTVVVGPNGKILQSLPLFEEAALAAEIPVYERQFTLYARLGNWLPILLAVLAALHILRTVLAPEKSLAISGFRL